jgi:outer membrane protein
MMSRQRLASFMLGSVIGAMVLSLALVCPVQAQQMKVAVVDMQAVLDESARGKSAKERLKELGDRLQEEIKTKREVKEKREEELQRLRTEIRSQGLVLTEQARSAKEEEFRKRMRELKRFIDDTNRFIEDATQEFREKEVRETQNLLLIVRKVVRDIGERDGYTLVLEGNENAAVVLYYSKAVDITKKVTQQFDQAPVAQKGK